MRLRGRLAKPVMTENWPWQQRLKAAGLTQRRLATILGWREKTVSYQIRGHRKGGVPQHLKTVILAWELMSDTQRAELEAAANNELSLSESIPIDFSEDGLDSSKVKELEKTIRELRKQLARPKKAK